MKRLHFLALTCVCLGIAAVLLFRANTHAIAAAPSSCGAWNVVPSLSNGDSSLYGVAAIAPNDIWAVGTSYPSNKYFGKTLIEHWDGTTWSIVPSPNVPSKSNALTGVAAVSATDIWAVGIKTTYGGKDEALIEHWDGTTWSIAKSPSFSGWAILSAVAAASATDIWAVGSFNNGTLIEHWNGIKWSIVPGAPEKRANLSAVGVISATDIWAVGVNVNPFNELIEHWDGTNWHNIKGPGSYWSYHGLDGVAAVSATDIWAVGYNGSSKDELIEHWDGTKWSIVPGASANGAHLSAVGVISATDIWAVGSFYNGGTLTEHWNGTTWSLVASPNPGDYVNGFNAVASVPGSNYVWAVGYAAYYTALNHYYSNTLIAYYC